ncbi:Ger(x)C family spore germination protein [Oceanobacillus sp. FSL W7-1309]|uniref:Ger(x)C family spore germination protein n=1 Tax=Oceanobacillus sp. FSL W7-1309 TaxID=2954539 RepID=UPI0030F5171A
MRNKKMLLVILFSFVSITLSACWDDAELEDREFIVGVAIDLVEDAGDGDKMFEMTQQSAVPAGLATATDSGSGKAYLNLSQTGKTLNQINAKISKQTNNMINTEHLKLILVSRELAEEPGLFTNVIDVFIRVQGFRRGIKVAIVDGESPAKEILNIDPGHAYIPAQYINELLENEVTPETMDPLRIGELQELLLNKSSFTVPLLTKHSASTANYESVSVFDGNSSRLVDTISGEDAMGLNFILGRNQVGSVSTEVEGEQIAFSIKHGNSKIKLINSNKDALAFHIDMNVEAQVEEYHGYKDYYTKEGVKQFEKVLDQKIKLMTERTIRKLKDDLQVDVMKLDDHLRMFHYDVWKQVKDNWDHGENYFANSGVTVDVNSVLVEPGSIIQIKRKGNEE